MCEHKYNWDEVVDWGWMEDLDHEYNLVGYKCYEVNECSECGETKRFEGYETLESFEAWAAYRSREADGHSNLTSHGDRVE